MDRATLSLLTEAEKALLAETERGRLETLDEDALCELHNRIRQARNKYAKLFRRQAGRQVAKEGGRGAALPKNRRTADKAEVFEDALARVSRRLAAVARDSAAGLKAERLQAAREGKAAPPPARNRATRRAASRGAGSPPAAAPAVRGAGAAAKSPRTKKAVAATRASGSRRQAKRDGR